MGIPLKQKVISELENYLETHLYPVPRKKIFYKGVLGNGKEVLVCSPQSKLYPNGQGWIDLTIIQVSMLNEADHSILAFRVEGDRVYYLDFCDLKPYLIEEAVSYNEREGDHWKLYLWPNYIQIQRNSNHLLINPNSLTALGV